VKKNAMESRFLPMRGRHNVPGALTEIIFPYLSISSIKIAAQSLEAMRCTVDEAVPSCRRYLNKVPDWDVDPPTPSRHFEVLGPLRGGDRGALRCPKRIINRRQDNLFSFSMDTFGSRVPGRFRHPSSTYHCEVMTRFSSASSSQHKSNEALISEATFRRGLHLPIASRCACMGLV
jgi:hypothetical protein